MENPNNQEKEPKQLSAVEQQKEIASEFVANRIEVLQQEKNIGILEAVQLVHEEVKGQKYREEQATAKLVQLVDLQLKVLNLQKGMDKRMDKQLMVLNLQREIILRGEEIKQIYPRLSRIVDISSTNGDKYLV